MNSYSVNLLPKKKNNIADKLLHFVLYYFRYIIIITQIVVIGVFFFRFREDQKVIDLKQKFRQKQQILAVTLPLVDEAHAIEAKTSYIKDVLDAQDAYLAKYSLLLKIIPSDVTLTTIELADDTVTIEGTSTSVESIRALHRRLIQTEGFETATIGTISSINELGFEFLIEALPAKITKK